KLRKRKPADRDLDDALLMALFRGGHCAELSVLVRDTKRSLTRDGLEVACAVVLRGMADGMRVLDEMRLPSEARQAVLEATLRFLVTVRAYAQAREVALVAIPGASDPVSLESQMRTLSRLKPYEQVRLRDDEPGRVVQALYEAMLDGRGQIADYERFFARASLAVPHGDALKTTLRRELAVLSRLQDGDMPFNMLRDSILSLTRFTAKGSDRLGYRVVSRIDGGADISSQWFVIKEGGQYKIRGGNASAWLLGAEALSRVERGRLKEAAQWLDWARGVWSKAAEAKGPAVLPFLRVWPPPSKRKPTRARIKTAAALLAALGPGDKKVIDALDRVRGQWSKKTGIRQEIDHAEFLQFDELDNDAGRLRSARRLRAVAPRSEMSHVFWTRALIEAGRFGEARRAIVRRQAVRPGDNAVLEQLANLAVHQSDFKAAERLLRQLIDAGQADARTYNNLAWIRLFRGAVSDEDLGLALRANSLSAFKNASQLHTLAALYAETGRAREALQLLIKRLDLLGRAEPTNVDWYLLGRIHEHFELYELARQSYEKVEPERRERGPDSTHALAQRKLKALSQRKRRAPTVSAPKVSTPKVSPPKGRRQRI
ncbi:MAG: hypothetical protein AAFV29_02470, partial [Myxococcota bacterium]